MSMPEPYDGGSEMSEDHTTAIVQRYLDELAGEAPAEPVVRALLDRAVLRLQLLCATLLLPRLPTVDAPAAQPPNGRAARRRGRSGCSRPCARPAPGPSGEFFALAGQHMRWELNDLARRLDKQPAAVELREGLVPAPASSDSGLSPDGRRMLEAIDGLPEDEREAFDLVRIQGLTYAEAAELLGVAPKTVQRRLDRGAPLLTERLGDLGPAGSHLRPVRAGLACIESVTTAWEAAMPDDPRVQDCSTSCSTGQPPRRRSAARARNCCPSSASGWRQICGWSRPELDALLPGAWPHGDVGPPCRRRSCPCRKSPATRSRRCSAAAAWASSTGPGTCGSTAPSPSR